MNNARKWMRRIIGLAAVCVLLFSVYQLADYLIQNYTSAKLNKRVMEEAIIHPEPSEDDSAASGETKPKNGAPFQLDFEQLWAQNEEIIAWLYAENTQLNNPVVQAPNNQYYLRRTLEGKYNIAGTLFADYRAAGDFSGWNTVIYGHNMKRGTMFGSLPGYRDQAYYDAHPVIWLMTAEQDYKLEVFAGLTTKADSEFYRIPDSPEAALELRNKAVEQSDFQTELELHDDDRWVTLSTCVYEFEDARYIVLGRLVPVER